MKNCPACKALINSEVCVFCGWGSGEKIARQIRKCHFEGDGKCRRKEAKVRINDHWICNYHYERGFDRQLRSGERISPAEVKINKRLFG